MFDTVEYWVTNTDIEEGDTRPFAILIPAWGSIWGSSGFLVIKIIVVRQVRKLIAYSAGWVWKQSHAKSCATREDREHICFALAFACVVGKNPKNPKLRTMADDAIARGDIGSLVSPFYICGYEEKKTLFYRSTWSKFFFSHSVEFFLFF